jgi:hemerythrin
MGLSGESGPMAFMEWQDSYSVGVAELDADHRRLIDIINRLDAAETEGGAVLWVLDELEDYVRYHFSREEARLKAVDYPELDAHIAEHCAFVEWLETVRKTYGLAPDSRFHLARIVNDYLYKWLTGHILSSDMAYRDYLV